MKKIVMATLFMAVAGVASAQVTLSGKVSEYVDNTKVGGVSTTKLAAEPTSNFALTVNEKLAGGLSARVVLETSLSGNTIDGVGTKLGDRQSTVGLAHSLGSIDLGRNVHSQFLAVSNNDVFSTLYGSVAGDIHNLRGLRFGEAVFVSLTPVKGVTLTYDRTQAGAGTNAFAYSASGSYAGVDATVARYENGSEVSTVLGGSTQVAGLRVSYTHSDNTGVVTNKGDLIGVSRTFGPVTAKVSYGQTNDDTKAYALGADYALSKRTEIGVAYRNVDRIGSANDVEQIGVGLTHRF